MAGKITTRHLITHARVIISQFGLKVYVRAWFKVYTGGTFLECI